MAVVLASVAFGGVAGAQSALSLDDAVREALEKHPLLAAADGRIATAQGLLEQAALRPNPRLSVQLENLRGWKFPYRPAIENDYFLYISQVLETNGKRERRGELAAFNRSLAATAKGLLRQQTAARVREVFLSAAGAVRMTQVYEETLRNFTETVRYHEVRVREGNMAEADLIRVRLENERLKLAAGAARREADRLAIALQRELGRAEIDPALVPGLDLERALSVPDESVDGALTARAEIALAKQGIEAAQANERLQLALARPDVELSGGYKRTNGIDGLLGYLNMDLPWRNRNQGNIAAASAETRVARSNLAAAEAQVRADVRAAYSGYRLRREQMASTMEALLRQARETARIAQAAYREGGTDLLRLLDAERTRLETELVRVEALTELRLSEVSILSAMGVMP